MRTAGHDHHAGPSPSTSCDPRTSARLSTVGLRTRKLRAGLSALGIAIGVAAIVAVLGLSSSASAGLLNEISALGTNLLVVENGQTLTGGTAELPKAAPAMIGRINAVTQVEETGSVNGDVYRSPLIPTDRHQRPLHRRRQPRPAPHRGHNRRPRQLPQRGHRPRARRRPRRGRRPASWDRPGLSPVSGSGSTTCGSTSPAS